MGRSTWSPGRGRRTISVVTTDSDELEVDVEVESGAPSPWDGGRLLAGMMAVAPSSVTGVEAGWTGEAVSSRACGGGLLGIQPRGVATLALVLAA